jgi:hypothetical protein
VVAVHETFGFYVQGVSTTTAVLPDGWQDRLVRVVGSGTDGRTGLCLDPHDLCLAKLAANREKDRIFVVALLEANLVNVATLAARVPAMRTADPRTRTAISNWLAAVEHRFKPTGLEL